MLQIAGKSSYRRKGNDYRLPVLLGKLLQGKPKDFKIVDITSLVAQAYGYTGKEAAR